MANFGNEPLSTFLLKVNRSTGVFILVPRKGFIDPTAAFFPGPSVKLVSAFGSYTHTLVRTPEEGISCRSCLKRTLPPNRK